MIPKAVELQIYNNFEGGDGWTAIDVRGLGQLAGRQIHPRVQADLDLCNLN